MEPELFQLFLLVWIGIAVGVFVCLFFVDAPYGKLVRRGWGPHIGSTAGWILMELPAVLTLPAFYFASDQRGQPAALAFLAIWELHYLNRTFVFPLRRRASGRGTPVSIVGMAAVFNLINGAFNGYAIFHLAPRNAAWLLSPAFIVGLGLFALGMAINLDSDNRLLRLRGPGERDYKIPRGGLFERVSCPNYLGEILEWVGWAVATWSLAGLSFALWTVANLAPRARSQHRWYRSEFDDYPPQRRALIPGLF